MCIRDSNDKGVIYTAQISKGGVTKYLSDDDFKNRNGVVILPNVSATQVLIDRNETIWVTTDDQGLFRIRSTDVSTISNDYTRSIESLDSSIYCIQNTNELRELHPNEQTIKYPFSEYGELGKLSPSYFEDILFVVGSRSIYRKAGNKLIELNNTQNGAKNQFGARAMLALSLIHISEPTRPY